MIRRAHQIAVSLFLEETGELGITNRQYGILLVLKAQPGIDQITVAKLLGLDRSTTGMVLTKLEEAGLVGRVVGADDRRKRSLKLTPAGMRMLERLAEPARRAQERVLSAFSPRERETFLDLLDKFARAFNDTTRVPQVVQVGTRAYDINAGAASGEGRRCAADPFRDPAFGRPPQDEAKVALRRHPMWLLWFRKYQSAISSRVAHHTPSNFFA